MKYLVSSKYMGMEIIFKKLSKLYLQVFMFEGVGLKVVVR